MGAGSFRRGSEVVEGDRLVDALSRSLGLLRSSSHPVLDGGLRDALGGRCAVQQSELLLDAPEPLLLLLHGLRQRGTSRRASRATRSRSVVVRRRGRVGPQTLRLSGRSVAAGTCFASSASACAPPASRRSRCRRTSRARSSRAASSSSVSFTHPRPSVRSRSCSATERSSSASPARRASAWSAPSSPSSSTAVGSRGRQRWRRSAPSCRRASPWAQRTATARWSWCSGCCRRPWRHPSSR